MRSDVVPESELHQGRVPPPPRQGGAVGLLGLVGALVVVGAGLIATGQWLTPAGSMGLGLQILGALMLVPGLIAAVFVLPAVLRAWRHRPAEELGWWTVEPGKASTFEVRAGRGRYHGLWLCLDVRYEYSRGPHYVLSTVDASAGGRTLFSGQVATCWGFPGDATGGTRMFAGGKLARRLGLPLSVVELDRLVEARPTGRFRARSLLLRLTDLTPGQAVRITLTVEPPARGSEMAVHAFVALPR